MDLSNYEKYFSKDVEARKEDYLLYVSKMTVEELSGEFNVLSAWLDKWREISNYHESLVDKYLSPWFFFFYSIAHFLKIHNGLKRIKEFARWEKLFRDEVEMRINVLREVNMIQFRETEIFN